VIEFTTDEPVNQVDTEVPHLDDISDVNSSDHDNVVSNHEEEVEMESPEEEEPFTRTRNPPGYLKDYITRREAEENDLQNGLAMFNTSIDPSNFDEASKLKVWREAMKQEIEVIESNNTWELTDLPTGCKKIGVKWIYKTKLNEKGEVEKYKARLVAKGYAQKLGIDYNEVFAPVARWDTIRTILAVAACRGWKVYQLDVKSAFLHGELIEVVYVEQPLGYQKKDANKVYKLKKALYGLRQAPRAWYRKIESYFVQENFEKCSHEHTLFVKNNSDGRMLIVSLYVDNFI